MTALGRKIRVLFCSPDDSLPGGIPAVVAGLLQGFQQRASVLEHRRLCYARPRRNIGPAARVLSEIRQMGWFVVELLRYKPDIVHVQTSFDKKTVIRDSLHLWIARLLGKKMVLHAHGGEWDRVPSWRPLWRAYVRGFIERCHCIIVTSSDEYSIIRAHYPSHRNVHRINNPVVLPGGVTQPGSVRPKGRKIVIFASRFIATKGILDVIDCAAALKRDDYVLKLYGDGELKPAVIEAITRRGLSDRVELVGEVPLADLIRQYLACDVYLFPSYHLEGFPMALFYAAACSVPIICTRVRPLPDFFTEPDNCLWVEPKNPAMLAEKLAVLLDDRGMRETMSANNGSMAKQFDAGMVTDQVIAAYRCCLAGQPGPGMRG